MSEPSQSHAPAAGASPAVNVSALLTEAMNKSGILWIEIPDGRTTPAWHVWDGSTAYVVSGAGEQRLPWLPSEVRIILRSKDTGGRLLTIRAVAQVLEPNSAPWQVAAELLKAGRLNATDDVLTRWATEGTITSLTPFDAPLESPGTYAADDLRAPVAPTSATTAGWKPWHWRGRGRKPRG